MELAACTGFDWDLGNIAKVQQRVDLAAVEFAFRGEPYVAEAGSLFGKEARWFLVNRVGERYLLVVFTTRGHKIRVISARYMHRKEAKRYAHYFETA